MSSLARATHYPSLWVRLLGNIRTFIQKKLFQLRRVEPTFWSSSSVVVLPVEFFVSTQSSGGCTQEDEGPPTKDMASVNVPTIPSPAYPFCVLSKD